MHKDPVFGEMKNVLKIHHRGSIRLKEYDYSPFVEEPGEVKVIVLRKVRC